MADAPAWNGRFYSAVPTIRPCGSGPIVGTPYTVTDMEMQLNGREASLVGAFRRLPPDAATELSALAQRLAELAPDPGSTGPIPGPMKTLTISGPHPSPLRAEESEGGD